jgi:hypothetical protein
MRIINSIFSKKYISSTWGLSLSLSLSKYLWSVFLQLGPKAEDIQKPVNPLGFLLRFLVGAMAATYFVLVPIYMWIKDQIVPKGAPI